jgi:hypothetical protein
MKIFRKIFRPKRCFIKWPPDGQRGRLQPRAEVVAGRPYVAVVPDQEADLASAGDPGSLLDLSEHE